MFSALTASIDGEVCFDPASPDNEAIREHANHLIPEVELCPDLLIAEHSEVHPGIGGRKTPGWKEDHFISTPLCNAPDIFF